VTDCTCGKPPEVCVCDRVERMSVATKVLVLQHPREQDRMLGTVPILERAVGAVRRVGLSWPNLRAALGEEPAGRWGVLWPLQLEGARTIVTSRLEGVVVLDGTWTQAKSLWWRNPWLLKLHRLALRPPEPSIYGRLRREPRPGFVSSLEAVADALRENGEAEDVRASLRRAMRKMIQRARDAPSAP